MPWRDQLRLGWRIIRWIWWPAEFPVWVRIFTWIIGPVVGIGAIKGNLLIVGAGCALALVTWFAYHWKD